MGKKSYESLNRLMYNYGCTGIHARSASSGEPFVSTGEVSYFKMQGFHRDCTPEQLENLKPRPRKKGKPEAIDGRDPNSKGDASDVGGCEKPSDEGLVENPLPITAGEWQGELKARGTPAPVVPVAMALGAEVSRETTS